MSTQADSYAPPWSKATNLWTLKEETNSKTSLIGHCCSSDAKYPLKTTKIAHAYITLCDANVSLKTNWCSKIDKVLRTCWNHICISVIRKVTRSLLQNAASQPLGALSFTCSDQKKKWRLSIFFITYYCPSKHTMFVLLLSFRPKCGRICCNLLGSGMV